MDANQIAAGGLLGGGFLGGGAAEIGVQGGGAKIGAGEVKEELDGRLGLLYYLTRTISHLENTTYIHTHVPSQKEIADPLFTQNLTAVSHFSIASSISDATVSIHKKT